MPIQPSLRHPNALRRSRTRRAAPRVNCPTIGQCFDIEVTRDADGWMIRIPEIGGLVRVGRRAEVDVAARQCIATRTGIPIGYVSVFVARETACTT
jgi:hypothetical protein